MRRNEEAALLGSIAGVVLLISGWTGFRPVNRFFVILEDLVGGTGPILLIVAYIFIALASLGGLTVLAGAFLIWKDHVRTGRILILVGSGAGIFTLTMFLLVNLRREEFSLALSVVPVIMGISIGIVARFWARATPLLRPS